MSGHRHFSQAIAEGDGISIIVAVDDPDAAHAAAVDGAEAIALLAAVAGVNALLGESLTQDQVSQLAELLAVIPGVGPDTSCAPG